MQWSKQESSAEQLELDRRACEEQAYREVIKRYSAYQTVVGPALVQGSLGRRLTVAGMDAGPVYPTGPFADQFGNQLMDEARLTSSCMREKGYQLVPVPKK